MWFKGLFPLFWNSRMPLFLCFLLGNDRSMRLHIVAVGQEKMTWSADHYRHEYALEDMLLGGASQGTVPN